MNRSWQTLEKPTDSPATNALSEALEQFDARLSDWDWIRWRPRSFVHGARVPREGV